MRGTRLAVGAEDGNEGLSANWAILSSETGKEDNDFFVWRRARRRD